MGTRELQVKLRTSQKDHPHAYGDKLRGDGWVLERNGSSPRVWGQGRPHRHCRCTLRIIPTRMGTRKAFKGRDASGKDHPHAYGDKVHSDRLSDNGLGSSPRVWGQGHYIRCAVRQAWIIPTRMGTRFAKTTMQATAWDHPHAYGDKI